MKVKIICFSIFIIVLYSTLLPQTIDQKIAQLEKRLSTVTGVEKVRVLLNLAETYRYKDLTRVVQYAHQALPAGVTLRNRNRLHNQGAKFYHHPGDNYFLDSILITDENQAAFAIYTYVRLH